MRLWWFGARTPPGWPPVFASQHGSSNSSALAFSIGDSSAQCVFILPLPTTQCFSQQQTTFQELGASYKCLGQQCACGRRKRWSQVVLLQKKWVYLWIVLFGKSTPPRSKQTAHTLNEWEDGHNMCCQGWFGPNEMLTLMNLKEVNELQPAFHPFTVCF